MLPSDLTGVSVWDPQARAFTFHPGPVFSDVVLADEINRANPKTQSALLEAMEERRCPWTAPPTLSQSNPVEMEGTYPLPEAQLDRFMVRASPGATPAPADERAMLVGRVGHGPVSRVTARLRPRRRPGVPRARVGRARERGGRRLRPRHPRRHAPRPEVRLGASPRAGLALLAVSRTHALPRRRTAVFPEDVPHASPRRARAPPRAARCHPRHPRRQSSSAPSSRASSHG